MIAPQLSPLYQVVTISEASKLFFAHPDTISYHIDRGNLIYRKSPIGKNSIILIELYSLVNLYGFMPDTSILGYELPASELQCGKTAKRKTRIGE